MTQRVACGYSVRVQRIRRFATYGCSGLCGERGAVGHDDGLVVQSRREAEELCVCEENVLPSVLSSWVAFVRGPLWKCVCVCVCVCVSAW